jgi:hypothetical protein
MSDADRPATAFDGESFLARGPLSEVALAVRQRLDRRPDATILTFDDRTGVVIDLDLRGTDAEIVARLDPQLPRGRGRPKLGVVAREITLLPRHWDWLAEQPGGASQALRRLIDEARRGDGGQTQGRIARERAYRVMSPLAGDRPGFEEATRALFANDEIGFFRQAAGWPADIRTYVQELAWSGVRGDD